MPRPTTRPGGCSGWRVPLTSRKARARRTWVWVALLITDGVRLAADPEAADGEVVGGLEADRDRSGEHVALLLGVLLELRGELLDQGRVVRREPVEVGLRQLDVEVVGHHPALAGQDLGVVVALALERGGDLDRLHRAAESPGEGSGDELPRAAARTSAARSRRASFRLMCSRPVCVVAAPPAPVGRGPSVVGLRRWYPGERGPCDAQRAGDARCAWPSAAASPLVRRFGARQRAGIALARFWREWRNRQTRTVQVRVSERTWGFNSPLAHHAVKYEAPSLVVTSEGCGAGSRPPGQ